MPVASSLICVNNGFMRIDIKGSSLELAGYIKQDPRLIERDLFHHGNEMLAFFFDSNFTDGFQNFKELKKDLFLTVVEDLAMGGQTLRHSLIGLTFRDGKVKTFITPLGTHPPGNVMCSISLKNVAAFQKWRRDDGAEIPQEELNAAMYRVVIALAEVV